LPLGVLRPLRKIATFLRLPTGFASCRIYKLRAIAAMLGGSDVISDFLKPLVDPFKH
jgi:hypothetical protein